MAATVPTPSRPLRAAALRRMKRIALAMLLAAVVGLVVSRLALANGGAPAWSWVGAFCEAAAVGAMADWFAVVALFRHPLGLPLPHTAIVPVNKARIADSLAEFVRDHFLEPEALLSKLEVLDPASRLAAWLGDPARLRAGVEAARQWSIAAVDLFDDARLRSATLALVIDQVRTWNAAATAAEALGVLTQGGRHQQVLDAALRKVAGFLAEDEVRTRVAELMVRHARKEWPKVVGMVELVTPVMRIADGLAAKLSASVLGELREVLTQPGHPVRVRYEAWLQQFVERLRDDPALVEAFDRVKARAVDDPVVVDYVGSVWLHVKAALKADLADRDSAIVRHLEQGLSDLGTRLVSDPALRASINEHLLGAASELAARLRDGATQHIAQTVKAWEDHQLVEELELAVGKDLQFIRLNGTLVGGLVGVGLYGLQRLIG